MQVNEDIFIMHPCHVGKKDLLSVVLVLLDQDLLSIVHDENDPFGASKEHEHSIED